MGASFSSSSGHFSHPDHRARFTRATNDSPAPTTCGMCQEKVEFNAAVYRCPEPGCPFILHDACYRRRQTISRYFAHPQQPLTLGPVTGRSEPSCTLCARRLSTPGFAYSCTGRGCAACSGGGGGFHSHMRCCSLPQNLSAKHEHGRLVLLPPSRGKNGNGERRRQQRTCIQCNNTAATGATAPWSYQCLKCDEVEVCLACLLGNDDDDDDDVRCCCCCVRRNCVDPDFVRYLGQLAGVFFCGFLSVMGCPGIPSSAATRPYSRDMELATQRN